ncbi:MAG: hypothetical protein ACRDPE_00280 [Solirubrobacterales bacterium]
MATVLLIVGIVLVVLGLGVFLWPLKSNEDAPSKDEMIAQGLGDEAAKVLEQLNTMLTKFDKRARPGMFVVFVGLALILIGAWLEAHDASTAAQAFLLPGAASLRFRKL